MIAKLRLAILAVAGLTFLAWVTNPVATSSYQQSRQQLATPVTTPQSDVASNPYQSESTTATNPSSTISTAEVSTVPTT